MIKYVSSLLLILITLTVSAQKKSVVNLIKSQSSEGIKMNGKDVLKVYKGVFQQDFSTMRSDSAYFYVQDNAFDAFGNVNITQGDTLNIFSDKLNYNGNTKTAILTDNVKMVDKDATLTTNYLTYNTATRIGTYTGSGKVVNKDNTITSKNGYYFAFSRDAYFRYNVVLVTPDALIKTDTLRYNTGSRISYFYGPTNIFDTKDKKDTLYTENGLYNTVVEQAFFGKKNLYKSGTKRLKGDSLFYDKKAGFGRAVKHVIFTDSEQKITLMGDLANYYKAEERTVVTKDPYVIIVTEEKDTTKTDTVPVNSVLAGKGKSKKNPSPIKAPSLLTPSKTSPASSQSSAPASTSPAASPVKAPPLGTPLKNMPVTAVDSSIKRDTSVKPDSLSKLKKPEKVKRDSVYISADTLETQMVTYKNLKIMKETARMAALVVRDTTTKVKAGTDEKTTAKADKKAISAKDDGKFLTAVPYSFPKDSLFTRPLFFGLPKLDTIVPLGKAGKKIKPVKIKASKLKVDTTTVSAKEPGQDGQPVQPALDKDGKTLPPQLDKDGKPVAVKLDKDGKPIPRQAARKPAPNEDDNDPAFKVNTIELKDTARIRIIRAYHHSKLFKSDLQAKSDSMFYSYSDSTLRCYVNPIIWTQGSQLSGDTINLQMRNKKMDNIMMFPSAFIVNVEKTDSATFNQVSGKRMRGFFKSDKLDRMYISGNAESIYFTRDSTKAIEMQRSLTSRMRILFKDNSATDVFFVTKPEHRYGPLAKFQEDERILKGFIWKPKERPISKESIIPSYRRKAEAAAAPPVKSAGKNKPGAAKPMSPKPLPGKRTTGDTTLSKRPLMMQPAITGKDTVPKQTRSKLDSIVNRPANSPAATHQGDTTIERKTRP
ncbi:hypothetical protein A0256_03055 [Mucilaginibacter sp. PAMC 26640]|nr:hypothetical protein A0256_03055 [Mucilaginibacter sp. PAMC 26640]